MIRLFNSLTQRKEELVPRDAGKVGIYACGPTVYNLVHIGNARPYVVFAVLRAWPTARGYDVTLVENITDVNDKINAKADAEGRSPSAVAAEFTQAYLDDTDRLGVPRPDLEPRASETIPEIIDLVCQLIAGGHAYESQGSVYFRVRSFPDYGKLSNQRIDELEEATRTETEPGKEDPLDFAVWKAAKPGESEHLWESPWGTGRPGWHIECSAMGLRYLGAGFDIHGGGRDLIFPHHENEIAQAEAAGMPFARIWMHNGMIRSGGEKMAKSVGNIFLLREVLDRYPAPVVLTYFLTTHYRSPLEFSLEKLDEAKAAYGRLVEAVRTAHFRADNPGRGELYDATDLHAALDRTRAAFAEHMDDDLNTAAALGEPSAWAASSFATWPPPTPPAVRPTRPPSKTPRTCSCTASTTSASPCPTPRRWSPASTPTRAAPRRLRATPTARSARPTSCRCRRPRASPTKAAGPTSPTWSTSASPAATPPTPACCATTCAPKRTTPAPTACAPASRRPASRCATRRAAPRWCARADGRRSA